MGESMTNSGTCYAKTPEEMDAVRNRTHGLSPRARQLLIMMDGKRDVASLQLIFPSDVLPGLLVQLTDAGLVLLVPQRALSASDEPAATLSASLPAPLSTIAVGLGDEDPIELGQIFMINLAKRILGVAGDPIIARLRAATDVAGLRDLYLEWRSTIKQAPGGLLRLKELEKKLSKVLGELPNP